MAGQQLPDLRLRQAVFPVQSADDPALLQLRQTALLVERLHRGLGLRVVQRQHVHPQRGPAQRPAGLQPLEPVHQLQPAADLCGKLKYQRFEPNGWTDVEGIGFATSIPDLVVRWLERRYLGSAVAEDVAATDAGQQQGWPGGEA